LAVPVMFLLLIGISRLGPTAAMYSWLLLFAAVISSSAYSPADPAGTTMAPLRVHLVVVLL
jgi:hypothetical protein